MPAISLYQPQDTDAELTRQGLPLPREPGNRTFGPRRFPDFDAFHLPSTVARFANPDEYASFVKHVRSSTLTDPEKLLTPQRRGENFVATGAEHGRDLLPGQPPCIRRNSIGSPFVCT
jgi:hypothetical protein